MVKARHLFIGIITAFLVVNLLGCTVILQKGRRSDIEKIDQLNSQLDQLDSTKRLLEQRLKQEISDKQIRLEMAEKGLVITFVSEVLFDSGKAKVRPQAYPSLDKVAKVLNENVPNMEVGIEGHTDNEPIRYSGWQSNWDLSSARALGVLHYLVDQKGIDPARMSAIAYGENSPVAPNDTAEGRQLNRRVEIVILPKIVKSRAVEAPAKSVQEPVEPTENLK